MKLPKSIIKKYGISKKAWQVFRGKRTKKKTGAKMVKRTKKTYSRRGVAMASLVKTGLGVGGYILFETFVEPYLIGLTGLGKFSPALNVVEIVAGAYFARRTGVMGSVAKAAVIINAYQLLYPFLGNLGMGAGQQTGNWISSIGNYKE